jgi:hypothetical protein
MSNYGASGAALLFLDGTSTSGRPRFDIAMYVIRSAILSMRGALPSTRGAILSMRGALPSIRGAMECHSIALRSHFAAPLIVRVARITLYLSM